MIPPSSPLPIFDLISLLAIASFFAWLGYAPLQSGRMKKESKKAKENLLKITDFFMISFLSFTVAGVADYLRKHPSFVFSNAQILAALPFILEATFVYGLLMLIVPMLSLRRIGRKRKSFKKPVGFADLNPSDLRYMFLIPVLTGVNLLLWESLVELSAIIWQKTLLVESGLVCFPIAVLLMMMYWNDIGRKKYWGMIGVNFPLLLGMAFLVISGR